MLPKVHCARCMYNTKLCIVLKRRYMADGVRNYVALYNCEQCIIPVAISVIQYTHLADPSNHTNCCAP